jgi:phenylacetate-CoA ligase
MYTRLFKSIVFPVLDRFNGTSVAQLVGSLDETQWWPAERLIELQREKLGRLRAWTAQHSDFYRDQWRRAPDDRRASSNYPELDGLPLVDKEDLRPALKSFPVPAFRGAVRRVQTSGSTGTPMTFFRSMEQESWFWATRIRMWQWAGYEPGSPYLAVNLNTRTAWKKRVQDLAFRCTYLTYNVANQDSERIVKLLRSRRITHINGFSSSVSALARFMFERGMTNPGWVSGISVTGDNLFTSQRQLIERVFGVGARDYYGAGGEGVHLASQCEMGDRYHLHMENAIVEIIVDGRPARPGESGRVVVTQLDNYAMPLIRYDLGDLATAADDTPCGCGRDLPQLQSVDGRACDVVVAPDGTRLLPQFFFIGAFKMLSHVERYQIVQDRIESITIRLVARPGCDRGSCEDSLRSAIAVATRGLLAVDFDWVDDIPLSGLGKPRPVVSTLQHGSSVPTLALRA